MATITPGVDATINAPTIEGQLFQLIHFINTAEAIAGTELTKFTLSKGEEGILTSDFTLDGQLIYDSFTGKAAESAIVYLASTTFTSGSTPGTIKGATLSQYFIDACQYALVWQRNTTKNPQKVTAVTLNFDYATATYSGSLSLPYATLITNDGVAENAIEIFLT
ncbi:MAG: hypothetical protein WBL95_21155 [Microcoleus sp.]